MGTTEASIHPASQGLRELADWLDANPGVPVLLRSVDLELTQDTAVNLSKVANITGLPVDAKDSHFVTLRGKLNGCPVYMSVWKKDVCTKRIVTREVEELVFEAAA